MNNGFGMIIEALVALLLMLTIGYCMMLNRRLKLLKADEESLRATISELLTATEMAERAIAGLKLTVDECEIGLGARLASGERLSADLDRGIASGRDLLARMTHVLAAGSPLGGAGGATGSTAVGDGHGVQHVAHAPRYDAQAVAVAAQAFAERLRQRVHGLAA